MRLVGVLFASAVAACGSSETRELEALGGGSDGSTSIPEPGPDAIVALPDAGATTRDSGQPGRRDFRAWPPVVLGPIPDFFVGEPASFDLVISGGAGGPYRVEASCGFPQGMTLSPDGRLEGIPCRGSDSETVFEIEDREGRVSVRTQVIEVLRKLVGFSIVVGNCRDGTVGLPFGCSFRVRGATYSCDTPPVLVEWDVAGSGLPPGLSWYVDPADSTEGRIVGIPERPGSDALQVRASDRRSGRVAPWSVFFAIEP